MRIGVIGVGNMGGMLARAFAADPALEVSVFNRNPEKTTALAGVCPNIQVRANGYDVVRNSDVVFVCTKIDDGKRIVQEIGPAFTSSQTLATTISAMPCVEWESLTNAKVAKVIPSIVQSARSGALLVAYGSRFDVRDRESFERLLRGISSPFTIDDSQMRVASDLASCGPAFLSFLTRQWASAAADTGQLTTGDAEHLLSQTVIGLAKLLESGMTFSDIIQKVSVPGGVTESGLSSLHRDAYNMFEKLHRATGAHNHGDQVRQSSTSGDFACESP